MVVILVGGKNQGCVWMVITAVSRNQAYVVGHLGDR